jgi:tryptophan-rich sensory protein
MAVAAWRVWRAQAAPPTASEDRRGQISAAMTLYAIQLALNLGWSLIFFGLHQIGGALIEIGLLWLAILVTAVLFWRADRIAGLLMLPYLAWTGFAAVLNHAFWLLNS